MKLHLDQTVPVLPLHDQSCENKRLYMLLSYLYLVHYRNSHVKQNTHPCYRSRRKCWFRRARCRQTSSRARSSSQSACTPPRRTISSVELNGSRTCRRRPHKWCGRSKSIARFQADVLWHEYLVTISSSYGYCSSRSKRNPRLRDSCEHFADDSFADESN